MSIAQLFHGLTERWHLILILSTRHQTSERDNFNRHWTGDEHNLYQHHYNNILNTNMKLIPIKLARVTTFLDQISPCGKNYMATTYFTFPQITGTAVQTRRILNKTDYIICQQNRLCNCMHYLIFH